MLHGVGVLVNVPPPERYACHKLLVSSLRTGSGLSKAQKDIAQAATLIEALLDDRPDDLHDAWTDLISRGRKWQAAATAGFRKLPEELRKAFHAPLD